MHSPRKARLAHQRIKRSRPTTRRARHPISSQASRPTGGGDGPTSELPGRAGRLDATFEQHCEGGTAAARGEVRIGNPAPPEQLGLGLAVAVDGTPAP